MYVQIAVINSEQIKKSPGGQTPGERRAVLSKDATVSNCPLIIADRRCQAQDGKEKKADTAKTKIRQLELRSHG